MALSWLITAQCFWHLLAVERWPNFRCGCYNGAMIAHLTEITPADVHASGFSIAAIQRAARQPASPAARA